VIWGGSSRLAFHGLELVPFAQSELTRNTRINLTFRKVY
jgi:alkylated DNA repair dioxygenase AlkB